MAWAPESPSWLIQKPHNQKAAETVLIRLRQKHDVHEEMETLRITYTQAARSPFASAILPRIGIVILIQAAFGISTSNALLFRSLIRNGEESEGGDASRWQAYFGLITLLGLLLSLFSVDSVRRKTILKDILPFVSALSILCGLFSLFDFNDSVLEALLFLVYFTSAMSLGAVAWLTTFELFHPQYQGSASVLSFGFYFLVQAIVYQLVPSLAISLFFFAGLCLLIVFVLFAFFASTKDGAIRLKWEKKLEREQDALDNISATNEIDEARSRSHFRGISQRNSRRTGNNSSFNSTASHGTLLLTPEGNYERYLTPTARPEEITLRESS